LGLILTSLGFPRTKVIVFPSELQKLRAVERSGAPHCDPEHFFSARNKMRNKKRRVASGMFYLVLCSLQRHISISESMQSFPAND
jgi:hypothetical protein